VASGGDADAGDGFGAANINALRHGEVPV
jgi:hypothetical protein